MNNYSHIACSHVISSNLNSKHFRLKKKKEKRNLKIVCT